MEMSKSNRRGCKTGALEIVTSLGPREQWHGEDRGGRGKKHVFQEDRSRAGHEISIAKNMPAQVATEIMNLWPPFHFLPVTRLWRAVNYAVEKSENRCESTDFDKI